MGARSKVSPENECENGTVATRDTVKLLQVFRYATAFDMLCMLIGFIGEGWVGSAQSLMMVLLGDLFDALGTGSGGGSDLTSKTDEIALKIAILGAANFVAGWLGSTGIKIAGLRQTAMWRKTYLKAILRQDVGWFDVNNSNELSTLGSRS